MGRVPRNAAPVRLPNLQLTPPPHSHPDRPATVSHRSGAFALVASALSLAIAFGAALSPVRAQGQEIGVLPLDAAIDGDGVTLDWSRVKRPHAGDAQVARRPLATGGPWLFLSTDLGEAKSFRDNKASPGIAWEYKVRRVRDGIVDQGYFAAAIDLPAIDRRGLVLLVEEAGLSNHIGPELDGFAADLVGDGWRVERLTGTSARRLTPVGELAAARELRDRLSARYKAWTEDAAREGDATVAVILVGDLPLVKSGRVAPDGHEPQPTATDLFYADVDGDWPSVGGTSGLLAPSRLPGNGIEMMLGRIDFSVSRLQGPSREIAYLIDYFTRNHAWRSGQWGDLRNAYLGSASHLAVEGHGLATIVGPDNVTPGEHHDVGEERRWLFGVDFGDYDGKTYLTRYAAKPVFAINFGSHKQRIDKMLNPMAGIMAAPNQALAVAWGARPAWQLHGMALGETIGAAQLRTANNRGMSNGTPDYAPTGRYRIVDPIWLNLLGDPTLHAFPVRPPSELTVTPQDGGSQLNWRASDDPELRGYRVYRARTPEAARNGAFEVISPDLISSTAFLDPAPVANGRYMVRALALKHVHAGSIEILSQGIRARE